MDRLRATDVKFLKGVGPKRAELLARELGIHTLYDLLYHFPTHYIDRSRFYSIVSFTGDMPPRSQDSSRRPIYRRHFHHGGGMVQTH